MVIIMRIVSRYARVRRPHLTSSLQTGHILTFRTRNVGHGRSNLLTLQEFPKHMTLTTSNNSLACPADGTLKRANHTNPCYRWSVCSFEVEKSQGMNMQGSAVHVHKKSGTSRQRICNRRSDPQVMSKIAVCIAFPRVLSLSENHIHFQRGDEGEV